VSGNPLANAWQAQHLRPELFGLAARVPTALVDGRREEFPFLRWAMDRRDISWESYRQSLEQDDRQVDESLQRFVTTHGLTTILYASGAGAEDQQRLLQITDAERWEALGVRFIAVQKDAPPAEVGN
jgi:hypothetical protein